MFKTFNIYWISVLMCSLSLVGTAAGDWVTDYVRPVTAKRELLTVEGIVDTNYRRVISLNGDWLARKQHEKTWHQVVVPGAYRFEGQVEYQRRFSLDSTLVEKTIELKVLGINYKCTIFVNDQFVGGHEGGHAPFAIEIENRLIKFGRQNEIRIVADNTLDPRNSLPLEHHPRILRNYGGIFRDIYIVAKSPISVNRVKLSPIFKDDYQDCLLTAQVALKNRLLQHLDYQNKKLTLHLEIFDGEGRWPKWRFRTQDIEFSAMITTISLSENISNLQLWSLGQPKLYTVRVYITMRNQVVDEYKFKYGFCDVKIDGEVFLLNGQPVRLQGLDWYGEFATSGPVVEPKVLREDIEKLKRMGANAIRVVGTPPHPYLIELCDEMGLLIFVEAPLYLIPDVRFKDQTFNQSAWNYYEDLLHLDSQHVSIAAWGLGYELRFNKPATRTFLQKLTTEIHNESNRPTYLASRRLPENPAPIPSDLLIVEIYNKDQNAIAKLVNQLKRQELDVPVLFSVGYPLFHRQNAETNDNSVSMSNGDNKTGNHLNDQQVQASLFQRALYQLNAYPHSIGIFIYTWRDWHANRPSLILGPGSRSSIVKSGLLTSDGQRRIAFDLIRTRFLGDNPPQLSNRLPDTGSPVIYPIAGLILIFVFLFNLNRGGRLRGTLKRVFIYTHGFYTDIKENRKVAKAHTFLIGILVCGALSIILSAIAYRLKESVFFDELLDLFVLNDRIKSELIRLIWHPAWFIATSMLVLLVFCILVIFLLKIISFSLGKNLRLWQLLHVVFWSAANFLWLLPIVPIYFRLINLPNWFVPTLWVLGVFCAWFLFRFVRGLKVLYASSYIKAAFAVGLFLLIFCGGAALYYDHHRAIFEYLPYYLAALHS